MYLTIIIWTVIGALFIVDFLTRVSFKVFLDLSYHSAGAVDPRDFMNYSEDSPVPQSHHAQD